MSLMIYKNVTLDTIYVLYEHNKINKVFQFCLNLGSVEHC